MTQLDDLIIKAYEGEGETGAVNKVYIEFLKTTLYLPIEKIDPEKAKDLKENEEPFTPLFMHDNDMTFMAAFDNLNKLMGWAGDHFVEMDYATIIGRNVIAGIGNDVILALNPGTKAYKEFSPEEIGRLKTMVQKIMQFKKSS